LPGGGSDDSESVAGTAVRETWEETGLRVTPEKLIGLYYRPEFDSHDVTYLCRPIDTPLEPAPSSPEISECRYWPVDDLPRPMSNFTEMRIRHGMAGETLPNVHDIEPLEWIY
jgi:8-oxo-dGTP diphosphatase